MSRVLKQTKENIGSTSSSLWTWKQVVKEYFVENETNDYLTTNKSIVVVESYLGRPSGQSTQSFGGTATTSITCDGDERSKPQTWNYGANNVVGGGWCLIQSEEFEVEHNSDGTKKISISSSLSTSSFNPNSASASGEMDLITIPRATACPNLDGYIESSAPISLNPASTSFKHRLYYSYNGKTGYYPSPNDYFANTGSLSLDSSFYSYTPSSSGTGSITLYTYDSNGNLIGSKDGSITVRCDADKCRPSIIAAIVDINETTKALTGNNSTLVKGFSNAQVVYSIKAKNGASIKNKTINGKLLGESPYTINNVSTGTFEIYAIDSRDFPKTEYEYNALVDYIPLTLDFNAFRPTPTGSAISINFQGNYFNGSFGSVNNELSLSWKYRVKGDNAWIDGGTFVKDTDYIISGNRFESIGDRLLSDTLFDYQTNYEIAVFYSDKLVDTYTSKPVPKGEPILSWEDNLVRANGTFMSKKNNIYFLGILAPGWVELGTFLFDWQGQTAIIDCYTGDGQNGQGQQNTHMRIVLKQGWSGEELPIGISVNFLQMYKKEFKVKILHLSKFECKLYIYLPFPYTDFNYIYNGTYKSFTPSNVSLSEEPVTDKEATYFKVVDTSPISLNINTEYVYSSDLNVTCFQIGNYVFLVMNVIAFNQEVPHLGVIMTGLPIPKKSEHCYIYGGMGSTTTREASRLLLDTNGELMLWHSIVANYGDSSNRQYSGILVYEVAD